MFNFGGLSGCEDFSDFMVRDIVEYHISEYREHELRTLYPEDYPNLFNKMEYAKGWTLTSV